MKKITVILLFLLPFLLAEGWVQAQSVGLRIPDSTTVQGTVLDIPLYVDSTLTGKGVYSYSFQLSYDPYYLQPVSVISTGTISEPFGVPVVNTSVSGILTFAAAGTIPLNGEGKLIVTRWKIKNQGWTQLSFTDLKHNYLNEGVPGLILKNGDISIQQAPTITVYPDNAVIAKGDQLQMYAYGGTEPYTWSVINSGIAGIDQNGLLTATASGMERVVAVDSYGVRDTTNTVEIRPLKLSIPQNLTQWEGATIDIPILTTNLNGLDIVSGSFQVGFDPNVLSPVGIVQKGTLLDSYQAFMQKTQQAVNIAFAGSTALTTGSDTLVFVRFNVLSNTSGYSSLTIDKALMNEKLLAAYSNGSFSTKNFNSFYISPSQGNLVVGESMELNLYGEAIPPWKWSVSDSTVASINQAGMIRALKRGQVTVSVIDSTGAPAHSGYFNVFDTRIVIPDTSICHYNKIVTYPVSLGAFPHDSIFSLEAQLSYDTDNLIYEGMETTGTVVQNWVSAANEKNGVISIASSGSSALSKTGVLFLLKFLPKVGFTNGTWAGINIEKFTLNEGSPTALFENDGYIWGISGNTGYVEIQSVPNTAICEGDTVVFKTYVQYGGYPGYQWLKNGNPIPGANADTLRTGSPANGDTISCRVTSTDPCVIDSVFYSNSIQLTVYPKPLKPTGFSGDTRVTPGDSKTYSVPEIPYADSYVWHLSAGVTGTSTTNSITVQFDKSVETALITVQGVNSCGTGQADSLSITVSPYTGLNTLESGKVTLYPNPFDNQLHIVLNNSSETKIDVYNAIGQVMKQEKVHIINEIILNFREDNAGIYFVRVTNNGETQQYKVVKR